MALWPSTLPQRPDSSGYNKTFQDNVVRFQPDVGPAVTRNRGSVLTINETWVFTLIQNGGTTELTDWRTFYDTTLKRGSLPIELNDPISGSQFSYTLIAAPTEVAVSGTVFRLTLQLQHSE